MGRDKILVRPDNIALFMCPHCDKMRHASVAKFKDSNHSLQVKCGCGQTFPVDLEFRSNFRKSTNLLGYYHRIHDKRPDPTVDDSNCIVIDLSLSGIGLQLNDNGTLVVGDEVSVEFILDDSNRSEIKRKFVVRHVTDDQHVGGEFCDDIHHMYDKTIGFYLMP